MLLKWVGKRIEGIWTLTHISSGLVFDTWEEAEKWETFVTLQKDKTS